jgi:glycosyltransferase involved in cell wall biosynthesis
MKVAHLEPVGGHGGMDYYDFGLCQGLSEAGVDVVLHTCDETIPPQDAVFSCHFDYRHIYGKAPVWRRGLCYLRGTVNAILSACRNRRPICHFHFFHMGFLSLLDVLLVRLSGRKVVITVHDVESFVTKPWSAYLGRWVYRCAHGLIVHNRYSKEALIDYAGLNPDVIVVIPHGHYLHSIRPLPERSLVLKTMNLSPKAKVILFFGQIKEVKGLDLLIEAMPSVLANVPEAVLLVAGRPWKCEFSGYNEQIVRLGIEENCVTHIRFIPDEEVASYYAAADIVVLPYRCIYQSGVLLMAMSYRKPVLVSDLPGMLDIVQDGETGFVFQKNDSASLATKLSSVLMDDEALRRVSDKGYSFIVTHHDWNAIGRRTAALYETVLVR